MSGMRQSLVLVAASFLLAGSAMAQDEFNWFNHYANSNLAPGIIWNGNPEPSLKLGSGVELTGFFIDCLAPWQTWAMLTSSSPAQNPQKLIPPHLLPMKELRPINDLAVNHESHFVLFRLSFP